MEQAPGFTPNAVQRILPPFWLFAGLATMALISYWYPTPVGPLVQVKLFGWAVFAGAFVMAWRAKRRFDLVATPVRPFTESTEIVEAGLFRFSRNPMYLALHIGLVGFAIAIGDGLPFIVIPVFFTVISTQFIAYEEKLMEARFGQAYLDYKSRVRRWL